MKSQSQMIEALSPLLQQAPVFEKHQPVWARPASAGEGIITHTEKGEETRNVAKKGDYVVQNSTRSKEQYIVKQSTFKSRYQPIRSRSGNPPEMNQEWAPYQPTGKCRAVEVTQAILDRLHENSPFQFTASWGEAMRCELGDLLVTPSAEGAVQSVYRIGRQEFEETYRKSS